MKILNKSCETATFYNKKSKIWYGKHIEPLYGPESSIGAAALQALLREPEHISQICSHNNRNYTNLEIANLSVSVAVHFKKLNVKQCDIVGFCASNSDYLAPLFFGAMLAGLTVSTLDPSFDIDGIKHIYSITKPNYMFCDGSIYENVKEALGQINLNIPIYTVNDHKDGIPTICEFLQENVDANTYKPEPLKLGHMQISTIVCSSGTTGMPKGVCAAHAMLLNNYMFELDSSDRLLCFSTLYWLSGLISLVVGTLKGTTRIISDRRYSPEAFLEIIEKYKATVVFSPPSQMAMALASPKLKDYDLSSVVYYFSGGSTVSHSLVQKFQPYIPNANIYVGYGMSEIANAASMGESSSNGSVGKLMPNTQIKVISDDGKPLGPREVGEICIKVMYPWEGYYGNETATKAIYSEDGWVYSGDLGYVDEEGNLYIIDRKKDILKYNNFPIYPTEIETTINKLPGVGEVCVCGIPDLVSSNLPAAAIVRISDSTLTEKDVYDHVAKNMAHFKHLRGGVYFLDSLPKTASGKNLRRDVTNILEKLRNEKLSRNGCANRNEKT